VLDGSGSMWGQIDKKAKITIAQEVIGELLETIPEGTELGLTVYGHRRKGSCKDIETLVEPGTDTRAAIAKAVNRIKPKGKTPLSAAVIAAAEHLKYTEEKATVILISDGRETCKLDPCEVGRKLEETGVDFTAHVIGFDVAKAEDRTQLQCLADATGGRFLTAANAAELSEALKVVSAPAPASEPPPPPPPPQPGHVRFIAIDGDGGPRLTEDLAWTVTNDESGALVADRLRADQLDLALPPGRYRAEVRRLGNETTAVAEIGVTRSTDTTVTLVLPPVLPEATLRGPKLAKAGETVEVEWTGPNEAGDYVAISKSEGGKTGFMATSATKNGSPLTIRMPPENGLYFLHYVLSSRNIVIATTDVEVLTVDASVSIQDSAAAGETVPMEWTGPGYKSDYISIAALNSPGAKTLAYTYASTGSPTKITMPTKPGEYEARYVMALGDTVLFRKKITVTPVSATLQAPQTATAGSDVRISWKGPDYALDFVSVAEPGTRGFDTINYTYTRDGNPLVVTMPVKPGNYELRYVLHQGNAILQTRPISVTEVTASLDAPDTALAGSDVKVAWTGPDYALDYISVAEPGSDGFKAVNFTYSRDGTPLRVTMPTKPGTYELRYVLHQGNEILASRQITVTGVAASLVAPDIAVAGADVDV
ncbi:MAG: VWA domain-containing protein, partial [Paracoccaceae bacterium]